MTKKFEEKIYSTFSSIASSLGYSEVHGRIISMLLVSNRPLCLDELAKKTGYSPASISLSLDLLGIVGVVKKIKHKNDRRLFVRLEGDLIEGLRNALLFKMKKEITRTLDEFSVMKKNSRNARAIKNMEYELKRLDDYVTRLSQVPIPKK